jgi:hypothetical protein
VAEKSAKKNQKESPVICPYPRLRAGKTWFDSQARLMSNPLARPASSTGERAYLANVLGQRFCE